MNIAGSIEINSSASHIVLQYPGNINFYEPDNFDPFHPAFREDPRGRQAFEQWITRLDFKMVFGISQNRAK